MQVGEMTGSGNVGSPPPPLFGFQCSIITNHLWAVTYTYHICARTGEFPPVFWTLPVSVFLAYFLGECKISPGSGGQQCRLCPGHTVTLSHCHTSHHRNTLIVLIAPARHGRHGPFVDNEFPGLTPVTGDEENYQHDQHDHHRGWQHLPQSLENVLPRYYSIRMLEIIWREILLSHFQVKTDLHSPAPASWI